MTMLPSTNDHRMVSARSLRAWTGAALIGAALVAGCGASGAAFGDTFPDNRDDHISAVLARLEAGRTDARASRRDASLVIAVTAAPSRLVSYDLGAGRALWESAVELRSVPQLAGDSVVTHEGSELVVRELRTGRVTSRIGDRQLLLVGAAGEGRDGVIVLSTGGGVGAFSVLLGLRDGASTFTAQTVQAAGAPAVSAGMAFVPWGHQNLSVLELSSGAEIARVRPSQGVVAAAVAQGGDVFFGQSGLAAFGRETSPTFASLEQAMPGDPQLLRDAYQPPQGPNSAQNRVRLAYRPVVQAGSAAFADGSVYLVFYRLVFALSADGRSARWVARIPRDAVGVQVLDAGVLVLDEGGGAHLLATADGRETWSAELGYTLVFAAARADGLTGGAPRGDAIALRDQLWSAAQDSDARLVPLRELAVRLLAAMPEAEVTANVIAICDDRATTQSVRNAACEALAGRTTGADHVIAALERHSAFLRGVRSPPVGALARAAVTMGDRRAVPLLVGHLRDPETAPEDIAPLSRALAAFGDQAAAAPLADFLRLYHAESSDSRLEPGLTAALEAYRVLAGPTSRELLDEIAGDALALESVRNAARAQVTALEAPVVPAAEASSSGEADGSADMALTEADDPRPAELTSSMTQTLLEPERSTLERCLVTPERVFQQARVVIVVSPEGQVLLVTTTPPAVLSCVEAVVRRQSFPATRARGRQQVTIEVRR